MKNKGYTYIEVIVSMGILSILLWNVMPQLRLMEQQGRTIFSTSRDNATMTQLVLTLDTELSDVHWPYWHPAPEVVQTEAGLIISMKTQTQEEWRYEIVRKDNSLILKKGDDIRVFSFSSIQQFKVLSGSIAGTDFLIQLDIPSQSLQIPVHFGSKAIVSYEKN